MANNVIANPGAGGATFATDDVGGVHYPITKVAYGAEDSANVLEEMPAVKSSQDLILAAINALIALHKAEDAAHVSGDLGIPALGIRQLADTTSTDADGDYTLIKIDEEGRVKVATKPASFTLEQGNITANAQTVFSDVRRASNVQIHMVAASLVGHNSTFEGSIDSTNGTDGNWFGIQVVRSNANTIETTTGVLAATPAYAWEASVNGLSFIRVRATAHTSGTATWKFQRGSYATEPIPAAQVSGTQPVSGTVTANIGTGSLAAGTNAIGDVGIQARANATGAASITKLQSAASTNATLIKATAGRVLGWTLTNTTAAVKVVRLYNLTVAPTVGTSVPVYNIVIPPNGTVSLSIPAGLSHATGISYAITNGLADLDATAVAANDVIGSIYWA